MITRAERLCIVGNGFDRYHGIPSDYRDFAAYLTRVDWTIHRMVGEYFSADAAFWADFEQRLAELDADQAVDYAMGFHSDEGHGHFQYELEQIATGLSTRLQSRFAEWIRSLPIPARGTVARPLVVDPTALFLNFNYTPTLERLYDVPRQRILHIHGYCADPTETLILGHGWERRPEDSLNFEPMGPDDDWRIRDGIDYIDDFFAATFKPTAKLILANESFFSALSGIREIRVMGHGLAEVDSPYLDAIMDRVDLATARWTISTYGDLEARQALFSAYDIDPRLVQYRELPDFD